VPFGLDIAGLDRRIQLDKLLKTTVNVWSVRFCSA